MMKKQTFYDENIETTFGNITIYRNDSGPRKDPTDETTAKTRGRGQQRRKASPSENNSDEIVPSPPVVTAKPDNPSEDFYGFENLNYFDQALIKDYKASKEDTKSPQQPSVTPENVTSNEMLSGEMNAVDELYFKKTDQPVDSTATNMSKHELEALDDINFIDQMIIKPPQSSPQPSFKDSGQLVAKISARTRQPGDESLGSMRSSSEAFVKKPGPLTEVPIVKSRNVTEADANAANFVLKKPAGSESSEKNKNSQHKLLQSEVPNWAHVTIDEAASVLQSHICYYNEEQGILALDKPYGLASMGGAKVHISVDKLLPALREKQKLNHNLLMCNRLDEFTTGVMIFAKNKEVATKLRAMYNEHKIIKQYLAITKHVPEKPVGEINIPLIRREVKGVIRTYLSPNYSEKLNSILPRPTNDNAPRQNAITKYRVLDSNQFKCSLIELQPTGGFQHQIRAHLGYGLGCPVLGDHKYSHHVQMVPQKLPYEMLNRMKVSQSKVRYVPMHLHAYKVILPEFAHGKNVFITAKLPLHFLNNLRRLKLKMP